MKDMKYIKSKVSYSYGSISATIITLSLLTAVVFYLAFKELWTELYLFAAIYVALMFAAMFYAPVEVELTDGQLIVKRLLRQLVIPVSQITSIRMLPPTMGAIRICGSGGMFGYWGWFREGDVGRYFAYYGKSRDCFFVRLADGRQYMIGCVDSPEIVYEVQREIDCR